MLSGSDGTSIIAAHWNPKSSILPICIGDSKAFDRLCATRGWNQTSQSGTATISLPGLQGVETVAREPQSLVLLLDSQLLQ